MDEWIMGACDQVDALAAQDPYYQKLSRRRIELENQCREILKSLPPSAGAAFGEYEFTIMEMAYQRAQIAYQLGKRRSFRFSSQLESSRTEP